MGCYFVFLKLLISVFSDHSQMSIVKTVRKLEPVTKNSVKSDVRKKNNACNGQIINFKKCSCEITDYRRAEMMSNIVHNSTNSWVNRIADHRNVRDEKQSGENPPRITGLRICSQAKQKKKQVFGFE